LEKNPLAWEREVIAVYEGRHTRADDGRVYDEER
jgi:hypothetical protein